MDIDQCFRKGFIRRTRIDNGLIKSLMEMAEIKEKAVKKANIDEETISAYVSLAYDSLREVLEAVCVSLGYKVISHICIAELLRRELKDFDYNGFDRMRYIRNSINYYGIKVELEQGMEIIGKIFTMKDELLKKYLEEFLE